MKKILIAGGESRLAQCFREIFRDETINLTKEEMDITSEKSITEAFSRHKFKYVLNCAAMTDMEKCEKDLEECFMINVVGPYLLNKICKEKGKKLIHISSDYAVDPVNNYGWSKFLSEQLIDKNFLIIRTSFFNAKTFIIRNLLEGRKTDVYKNIYFNPISINRLAREIMKNISKKGLINIFSSKRISFYDFAVLFSEIFGIRKSLISPVIFKENKKTKRKKISVINSNVKIDIKRDMRDFKSYQLKV